MVVISCHSNQIVYMKSIRVNAHLSYMIYVWQAMNRKVGAEISTLIKQANELQVMIIAWQCMGQTALINT